MVAGALYRDRSTEGARWLKQWVQECGRRGKVVADT